MRSKATRTVLAVLSAFTFFTAAGQYEKDKKIATLAPPPEMVLVPGGTYTPFFETDPDARVQVLPFYMDVTAVTNSEFLHFVKLNPKWARSKVAKVYADTNYLDHWEHDFYLGKDRVDFEDSPVTNVSWHAAQAYCKWQGKRLPSMVEWEFAGNAPVPNATVDIEKIQLEWYSKPTPKVLPEVRSTFKNKYGLYDMHGLIWEWVSDFNSIVMDSDSRSNTAIDRQLYCASGSFGAADKEDYAAFMRFAYRSSLKSNYTVRNLGFRCVTDVDQPKNQKLPK